MTIGNKMHYWNSSVGRIETGATRLRGAIQDKNKGLCFETIQAIDQTLVSLRASLRENMD